MSIGIILQARMGSTRLPGKVLRPLNGIPMLDRIVARLDRQAGFQLVVATGDLPGDDPVAAHAEALRVPVFRGSSLDVLDRYYHCALSFGFTQVIRATADNPFVDMEEGKRLLRRHQADGADYSLTIDLPVGVGLEIFTFPALARSWREGRAPHHREHVNEYILERPEVFRITRVSAPEPKQAPGLRLTVDTAADLARAEALLVEWRHENGMMREGASAGSRKDGADFDEPGTEWLVTNAARVWEKRQLTGVEQ
ncbi:cytidylyltransferase domain-containing protein [Azospirillum argentinense]|uniref:Acylneuraminate cytidylyltransferase n=1 Tax=Azospirillum brasilense TaxID=192 RepID=A0A4D8QE61_AZOBR|nr:NTP transferase domain-containing protein [Azospirillum argentinense]QCO07163.1 acylneuraminate cytidylyltransferase [Azospirillum argentinense]